MEDVGSVQQKVQSAIFNRTLIGNYEIIKKIGEGSFSSVFLASHIMTRHEVVLKSVNKTQNNLAAEIANMSLLSHPHIVRLYEYIIMPDKVWLVLEYCGGDELLNYLVKFRGGMPVPLCTKMFAQLAGAVAYAHQLNCAHRDLKLENVLLDIEGNIKLIDFGFTRSYLPRTFLETVCGTESYMAPELLQRKKYLPEASDVWSLGVILYALIYGKLPFDEDNTTVNVKRIVEEDPVYYQVPPEGEFLVSIVKKMLNKNPLQRPRAMEMLDALGEPGQQQKQLMQSILNTPKRKFMFSSKEERTVLKGMKALAIDLHTMASSVVHHKCDPLHGLWFTALDKQSKQQLQQTQQAPVLSADKEIVVYSPSVSRARSFSSMVSNKKIEASEDPIPTPVKKGRQRRSFKQLFAALKIHRGAPKETLMTYYEPTFSHVHDESKLALPQSSSSSVPFEAPPKIPRTVKRQQHLPNRRRSTLSITSSLDDKSMSRPMSTYSQVSQISQLSQSSVEASKLLAEASSQPGSPQERSGQFDPPDYSPWGKNKRYATAPSSSSSALSPISRQRRLVNIKEKIPHKIDEGDSEGHSE